jgi:quinoprotein dehydrogenase-associated probable ABC transporter substrate-binding protein
MVRLIRTRASRGASLVIAALALAASAAQAQAPLRLCADPGNMPLSNNKGEGFENKIAAVLAQAMNTTVENYYRPGIERGLIRNTLDADVCDVMLDMPTDSDDVLTTNALYRTTYVLVTRTDRNLNIKSLADPRLKTLKVGVYETSAIREALADHGVGNVQIHYLSHNADLVPQNQPSYQIQQVIDGKLDVAAVWGPLAGYYQVVQKAPISVEPANLMDDSVPLQYDMAIAVRRGNRDLQQKLNQAMKAQSEAIKAILVSYGVPLVSCDSCIISGDLPAHGPYKEENSDTPPKASPPKVTIAQLNDWLAQGANPVTELNNAVMADDETRVAYLLDKKHVAVSSEDLQGETPLHYAIVQRSPRMVAFLVSKGADVNQRDRDGWTPLMTAAYCDDALDVKALIAHGGDPNAVSKQNLTPLGIAAQYDKKKAALALVDGGADPGHAVGDGGYTPLMLASANDSQDLAQALIGKGADVNARNAGGVTALMMAAANSHADMVQFLVRSGANVKAQTDRGDTALSIARAKGDEKVIKLLSAG